MSSSSEPAGSGTGSAGSGSSGTDLGDSGLNGSCSGAGSAGSASAISATSELAATPAPPIHGQCLCGQVSFNVSGKLRDVLNCHCQRCRRFSGHFLAATAAPPDNVKFTGERTLRWYSPHPTVEYGFCGECGSSLFWRALDNPDSLSICAGVLDPPTGLRTIGTWWASDASDYHQRQAVPEHQFE